MIMWCGHTDVSRAASESAHVLVTVPVVTISSLQYINVTALENSSFAYVIANQVKIITIGFQKLQPVTDVLPA